MFSISSESSTFKCSKNCKIAIGKKNVSVVDAYSNYIEMCKKYGIGSVYKGNILEALKLIELAGFIELKGGVWITKLDLGPYTVDDWIEAIFQSPEFDTFKK